jgi:hypothetical protein
MSASHLHGWMLPFVQICTAISEIPKRGHEVGPKVNRSIADFFYLFRQLLLSRDGTRGACKRVSYDFEFSISPKPGRFGYKGLDSSR